MWATIGLYLVVLALLLMTMLRRMQRVDRLDRRMDSICGSVNGEDEAEQEDGWRATLERLGFSPRSYSLRVYLVVAPLSLAILTAVVGWKAGLGAALTLAAVHFAFFRWHKVKRDRKFANALPGLLERVHRMIMIGNTLPQAFIESVEAAEPVVRQQIDPVVRRIRHGASFADSIDMLANHINIIELHMLAAYVRTNAKFGGRVAQTLVGLIAQLSNKRRLEREIRAATAETRASAAILFGLMTLTMVLMSVVNPSYIRFFLDNQTGQIILAAIVGWPLLGVLVMRRILVVDF